MNPHNDFEIFDDFGFEIDNKFYLDDHHDFSVSNSFYHLFIAVLTHRIKHLEKDLIHSADDLLGEYFKEDIDGEDVLALCCLERLIELGQLPIMEIPRNDGNGRKYILL
jgi:hypothetical protein